MIKKLDFYIIRLFLKNFISIFSLIFILFIIQFFWSQIEELIGKEIDTFIIIKFIIYFGIYIIPLLVPITILLNSIITFGELSDNQEILAIKMAGISLFRIMIPVLWIIINLSFLLYFFSDLLVPKVEMRIKELGYQIISTTPNLKKIKEKTFIQIFPNFFIKVDKVDHYLHNIFIFFDKDQKFNTIVSKQGSINVNHKNRYIQLKLNNGYSYREKTSSINDSSRPYYIIYFNTMIQRLKIPFFSFQEKKNSIENQYELRSYSTKDLIKIIDFLKKNNQLFHRKKIHKIIHKLQSDLHKKFTFPITCIIMFFIGSSFGSIIRKGGVGYSMVIALVIFIIYYTILTITQNQIEKENISPWIGEWTPNIIFLPFSIWITYKVTMNDYYYI